MYDLTLRPGPELILRFPESVDGKLIPEIANVTGNAMAFLFHSVCIETGVTLGHVLRLFQRCPGLVENFKLFYAEQLCAEAFGEPNAESDVRPGADADSVEYLELAWVWAKNTGTAEFSSATKLRLDGVGYELTVDSPRHGLKAGERVRWSVSLMPVRELLDLPIVFRPDFNLIEDDPYSKNYGKSVAPGVFKDVALGQVLHGLLSELCFHGSPEDKSALAASLRIQVAEIEAGTEQLVDADDVLDGLVVISADAFDAMFERNGRVTLREIHNALSDVDDSAAVGPAIAARFDGRVTVRHQFGDLGGREFRRLLAEWRVDGVAGGGTLLDSVLSMTTDEVRALTQEADGSGIAATVREVFEMSSRARHGGVKLGEAEYFGHGRLSAASREQQRSLQQMLELARGLRPFSRWKVGKVARIKAKLRAARCPIPTPRREPAGLTQRAIEAARRGETATVAFDEL